MTGLLSSGLAASLLLAGGMAHGRDVAGAPPAAPSVLEALGRCAPSAGSDDIVVCGRRNDQRYRLPVEDRGWDPDGPQESVARERGRLLEGGESGTGSCSTAGAGGWTGCFAQEVKRRQQQRAGR